VSAAARLALLLAVLEAEESDSEHVITIEAPVDGGWEINMRLKPESYRNKRTSKKGRNRNQYWKPT